MGAEIVLPYRTDVEALGRWLSAVAHGREPRLGEGGGAAKAAEGAAASATALRLVDAGGELTEQGRRFVLGDAAERRSLLREGMLGFEPYRAVMRAVAQRTAERVTEIPWIETWWATHGYGNSASNRREGAAVFGRLAEFTGLGRYIPGRRGHATRLEWEPGALGAAIGAPGATAEASQPPQPAHPPRAAQPPSAPTAAPGPPPMTRVSVPLEGGGVARLELPARLPAAEKRRLLAVLDLLISEEGPR